MRLIAFRGDDIVFEFGAVPGLLDVLGLRLDFYPTLNSTAFFFELFYRPGLQSYWSARHTYPQLLLCQWNELFMLCGAPLLRRQFPRHVTGHSVVPKWPCFWVLSVRAEFALGVQIQSWFCLVIAAFLAAPGSVGDPRTGPKRICTESYEQLSQSVYYAVTDEDRKSFAISPKQELCLWSSTFMLHAYGHYASCGCTGLSACQTVVTPVNGSTQESRVSWFPGCELVDWRSFQGFAHARALQHNENKN